MAIGEKTRDADPPVNVFVLHISEDNAHEPVPHHALIQDAISNAWAGLFRLDDDMCRGREVAKKVLGEEKLDDRILPSVERRLAILSESGSGVYVHRLRLGPLQPKMPKEILESSYALLSEYVNPSLGEDFVPEVSFDDGITRWNFNGKSVGCVKHSFSVDRPCLIELRLQIPDGGGEDALKNSICVVEDAAVKIGKKYKSNDNSTWKFVVRR